MTLPETGTTGRWHAGKLDDVLAYLYAPLRPLTRRLSGRRTGERGYRPRDVLLPRGFTAEVVATGLNEPVHCTFDDEGRCYVVECGHKIDSAPRVVAVDVATGEQSVFYQLPDDRWSMTGAVTGAAWRDGRLYVADTDRIFCVDRDGRLADVVTGLPGRGDHQTNHPAFGPDGKLYWGQGSATNTGVVGADNAAYEWLPDNPDVHDVPAADITLTGRNLTYRNVLGHLRETKVARVDMRTGEVHDFAVNRYTGPASTLPHDGFERPSHCAFGPDGCLYVVDFGEIAIAPEVGGIRIKLGTGALWRIRRTGDPVGKEPPQPRRIPLYALQLTAAAGAAAAAATWLIRRLLRPNRPR